MSKNSDLEVCELCIFD